MATVLVTGASGDLGRHVVREAAAAGHSTIALVHRSRDIGPGIDERTADLRDGQGLEQAVEGIDVLIHCATSAIRPGQVDVEGTGRLIRALESAAPSAHLVYVSIVGVDDHPYFYYRAKVAAERRISASGVGWTILRATQFFELLVRLLRPFDRLPFALVPDHLRFQPMAASEAAQRLVQIAAEGPSGRVADISGPAVRESVELGRAYRRAIGKAPRVLAMPLAGRTAAAFRREGHILGEPRYGRQTWEEFLAERAPS